MYEDLLSATHEAGREWTESKVSARFKGVNVEEHREEGTTELKSKIYLLTAILRSSNFRVSRPQEKEKAGQGKTTQKSGQGKSKSIPSTPLKGKGPGTPAVGQCKGSQKPIQCYNCGGWGHGWRECPSKGNFNWRELSGAQVPLETLNIGPKPTEDKQ